MKIEVGKKYRSGSGNAVEIRRENGSQDYPFTGDDGCTYTADGAYCIGSPSPLDLVAEIVDEVPSADGLEVAEHAVEQVEAGGCAPPVVVGSEREDEPHPVAAPEIDTAPDFEFVEQPRSDPPMQAMPDGTVKPLFGEPVDVFVGDGTSTKFQVPRSASGCRAALSAALRILLRDPSDEDARLVARIVHDEYAT